MTTQKPDYRFHGGVHPAYLKELTRDGAIRDMPLPSLLRVSMAQHLGAPAKPLVAKGDHVLRGQKIGEPVGFISAAVHAPTSGTVAAVADAVTASGAWVAAIDIEPDGADAGSPEPEGMDKECREFLNRLEENPASVRSEALARIARAGIVGMGGAGFPTHVKLSPPPDKPIDTLVINGAECEPYLTADNRLMIDHADEIWHGARILQKILGAKAIRIGIEDNKPEAIQAMQDALGNPLGDVALVVLPTEYPQGAEKQQIFAMTGRQVPSGGLPMDVGAVVENVGTTFAVWDALANGKPLIQRVTTVTGRAVANPGNVLARIGTLYSDLVAFCGGAVGEIAKVISGGPMMGLAQSTLAIPTTKTTSGLVLLDPGAVSFFHSMPCISCGRCVDACPMNLVPSELSQMLEAEDYEGAEGFDVLDCIECGCCAFVCPAHRPLVQHMRQGKARIMLKRKQAQAKPAQAK